MARRVWEKKLFAQEGKDNPPLGTPKELKLLEMVEQHATFNGVYSLQFNYDGTTLAVGFGSGGIQAYKGPSWHLHKQLRACRQGGDTIMCLRFHPNKPNTLYTTTTAGYIFIFNVDTGELLTTLEENGNEINALSFSVDGLTYATVGRDLGVRVYDTKNNKILQHYQGHTQGEKYVMDKIYVHITNRVFAIKYHPDNKHIFVTGGWDDHLKIWDSRSNDGIKRNIHGPHICGDSIDIKGNKILSGQWRGLHALQEFDYTSGRVVKELKFPFKDGAFLYCAHYCNDDLVAAGGSGTQRAELIEISSNTSLLGFDLGGSVQALDTANNGRIMAMGGTTPIFYILSVSD